MQKQLCLICLRGDEQVKTVLHFIRKRLRKMSNEYIPDYREQTESDRTTHGFSRLLGVIMGERETSNEYFQRCSHEKFSRYLRRKLKCDNGTFGGLCNELVEEIAERNYHLEVLSAQMRNLSESCLRLAGTREAEVVRAAEVRKREGRQATMASVPSEAQIMRSEERASSPPFEAATFNQFGAFGAVPIMFMGMGVAPLMEGSLFPNPKENN